MMLAEMHTTIAKIKTATTWCAKFTNNRKKIIIVDNSLNHFAGKKVGDFLEKIYNVEVIQYLPVYKLKYFYYFI